MNLHKIRYLILNVTCFSVLAGCTAATTDVSSLLANLDFFKLSQNEVRIANLSELSNITIQAQCNSFNSGFEFDFTNTIPETWIPAAVGTPFTSITESCTATGQATFNLDLSSQSPFSTMSLGDSLLIKIRDINALNITTVETFRITYSFFKMTSERFSLGQGVNNTLCSGSFCLKGRLTKMSDLEESTSGSYSLQGRVVFQ